MPKYWVDQNELSDQPNNLRRENTVVVALEITSQPGLSDSFHS